MSNLSNISKNNLLPFLYIVLFLLVGRLIPHPPNFTSLIALTFYVPIFLGLRYLPALIISFIITDFVIGYHSLTHWTWGSVFLIGLISQYFNINKFYRIFGASISVLIFFFVTNFGVWTGGSYGYSLEGLINCYILAIPFLGNNLLATLMFSLIIELIKVNYRKFLQTN